VIPQGGATDTAGEDTHAPAVSQALRSQPQSSLVRSASSSAETGGRRHGPWTASSGSPSASSYLSKGQQVTHTHTRSDREQHPRHRHTHTRQEQHFKLPRRTCTEDRRSTGTARRQTHRQHIATQHNTHTHTHTHTHTTTKHNTHTYTHTQQHNTIHTHTDTHTHAHTHTHTTHTHTHTHTRARAYTHTQTHSTTSDVLRRQSTYTRIRRSTGTHGALSISHTAVGRTWEGRGLGVSCGASQAGASSDARLVQKGRRRGLAGCRWVALLLLGDERQTH